MTRAKAVVAKQDWEVAIEKLSTRTGSTIRKLAKDCADRDQAAIERAKERDALYDDRHTQLLGVVNEIAPWVQSNMKREEKRAQTMERVYHLAVSEATAVVVKTIGWAVGALAALYFGGHTQIGQLAVRYLLNQ